MYQKISSIRVVASAVVLLILAACGQSEAPGKNKAVDATPVEASANAPENPLGAIIAAQPAETKARYAYRHPKETLEFFGIEPGMTVVEALPGGGWYTKIIAPYLGVDGAVIGADYDQALFPLFGFFSDEALEAKKTWTTDWPERAASWFDTPVARIDAFQFGSMPSQLEGTVDAVLFIRALHNLARFEGQGGFQTAALQETLKALKPGGVVGVVQHMAPEDADDSWAGGAAGYIKKSYVIATLEAAGLELVAESDINRNPKDQPTNDDIVWRLPPTLHGTKDNPEQAAINTAIGESDRMTLLFRKPADGADK
ncbi:class I SAM-dependent methyltransferase [Porticoccus sp. GXU_MW_L64]